MNKTYKVEWWKWCSVDDGLQNKTKHNIKTKYECVGGVMKIFSINNSEANNKLKTKTDSNRYEQHINLRAGPMFLSSTLNVFEENTQKNCLPQIFYLYSNLVCYMVFSWIDGILYNFMNSMYYVFAYLVHIYWCWRCIHFLLLFFHLIRRVLASIQCTLENHLQRYGSTTQHTFSKDTSTHTHTECSAHQLWNFQR